MRYYRIDRIDKDISVIGLGTMGMTPLKERKHFEVLDAFVEHGGSLIDTAEIYGDPENYGLSEKVLGSWFVSSGVREQIVLTSKGCIPGTCAPLHGKSYSMSGKSIHTAIDGSLERMKTDYLDLWLLHRDDESLPVDIYIDVLNAEVQKGRLRAFGCSNWKESRIEEANAYARENKLLGFSVSSPQFSCLKPRKPIWDGTTCINDQTRGWYVERRFPVFAWSALARGFLWYGTDGYRPNDELESVFKTDENLDRLRRMDVLAEKKGITRAEIALFSVLHQDFPVSALIASRSVQHLVQCMRSADLILTPEETAYLESAQFE